MKFPLKIPKLNERAFSSPSSLPKSSKIPKNAANEDKPDATEFQVVASKSSRKHNHKKVTQVPSHHQTTTAQPPTSSLPDKYNKHNNTTAGSNKLAQILFHDFLYCS